MIAMSSTDGPALPPISERVASPVVLRNSVAAPVVSDTVHSAVVPPVARAA